ncbi:hypothetical protein [Streptosporangium sp. OZ121]|uniref:hypothetical protein n=1 Tax=Streptosporangium sp. OZ121 TaxID=3444183 RepID=UPI003F791237
MYGWVILGDAATKRVNGQEIIITAHRFGTLDAAIRAWEDNERHRMAHELGNLGHLVNDTLDRLRQARDI